MLDRKQQEKVSIHKGQNAFCIPTKASGLQSRDAFHTVPPNIAPPYLLQSSRNLSTKLAHFCFSTKVTLKPKLWLCLRL